MTGKVIRTTSSPPDTPLLDRIRHGLIGEDDRGHVDIAELRRRLVRHAGRPLRIGSFSAASNVTGVLTDIDSISALLHEHGALSFWDYGAAGPHVPIRVRESAPGRGDHEDAVFLSPHKFAGGPQTPGVLVLRRDLVTNSVPTTPGGTPAIVESIRAGSRSCGWSPGTATAC